MQKPVEQWISFEGEMPEMVKYDRQRCEESQGSELSQYGSRIGSLGWRICPRRSGSGIGCAGDMLMVGMEFNWGPHFGET
jgi:hypothetical protein